LSQLQFIASWRPIPWRHDRALSSASSQIALTSASCPTLRIKTWRSGFSRRSTQNGARDPRSRPSGHHRVRRRLVACTGSACRNVKEFRDEIRVGCAPRRSTSPDRLMWRDQPWWFRDARQYGIVIVAGFGRRFHRHAGLQPRGEPRQRRDSIPS
jgi:hypothetical protein